MRQKRSSAEKRYHVGILRSQEHPQRVNDPSLPSESFSRRTNTTVEHAPKFPWDQGDSFNLFKTVIRPTSNNMKKKRIPFRHIFFWALLITFPEVRWLYALFPPLWASSFCGGYGQGYWSPALQHTIILSYHMNPYETFNPSGCLCVRAIKWTRCISSI